MWTKKIEIKDENHLKEVLKAFESLGEKTYRGNYEYIYSSAKSFWYDDKNGLWCSDYLSVKELYKDVPEYEIITKTSYELKEVQKREIIKIGEKEYYKDELEIALKNIKPI